MSKLYKALPMAAAFFIAAAFVVSCLVAPVAFSSDFETVSVAQTAMDELRSRYSLDNIILDSNSCIVGSASLYQYGTYQGRTMAFCAYGTKGGSANNFTLSNARWYYHYGTSYGTGTGTITVSEDGISGLDYYIDFLDVPPSSSPVQSWICDSISLPTSDTFVKFEAIKNVVQNPNNLIGLASLNSFSGPDSVGSSVSYHSSQITTGNPVLTTTTTATTTTTTTTTIATLPPYPYQTNPPFELPSEWTADYSETTPVPSVPPFTTAAIKDVDDALDGADSSFIGAIGFWFLVLGEILNDYPLLVYMIVFTIAILLLVGLLYNGGGDDK